MISRRLIRIKVLQMLYSYFQSKESSFYRFEQQLFFSIHKSYDLYHYLMLLLLEISEFAGLRIEAARNKNIQNAEDINPNTKFIDNRVIHQLSINSQLKDFVKHQKLNWSSNPELIKNLFFELQEFEPYKEYMATEAKSYIADKKIVIEIFSKFLLFSESLDATLEEQSIYWNDDIEHIVSMISKTIKQFRADDKNFKELMPLYRDVEDEEFAKKLFRKVILHNQEHRDLINLFTKNWEVDRIAFIDTLILQIAITEIIEFESIPIRVSFNEYIELSKIYSTEKSSNFINGILDNIIKKMKKDNKFTKTGRGLLGD